MQGPKEEDRCKMDDAVRKNETGRNIIQMAGKIWVLVGKALSCNLWNYIDCKKQHKNGQQVVHEAS